MTQERFCPICQSSDIKIKFTNLIDKNFGISKKTFDLFECKNCHAVFIYPLCDPNELKDFYPLLDYQPHQFEIRTVNKHNPTSILYNQFRVLHNYFKLHDEFSLIDLGCGGGSFLFQVNNEFPNSKLFGVDFSEQAIQNLKSKNLNGFVSNIDDIDLEIKFDVVNASQLLEHVPNPHNFIKKIKQLTHKGSIILLDVPDTESYTAKKFKEDWLHWDIPRHQINYSRKTLEYLLKDFDTIELCTVGSPYTYIDSYNLSKYGQRHPHKKLIDKIYHQFILKIGVKIWSFKYNTDVLFWVGRKR
jgi:SAM-dependent methyltransferase